MVDENYSLDALNKFLDYASNKGLLKKNTAQSRKQAVNKILSVLETDEINDLRDIDVQQTFNRFANLQGTDFKPTSLQVYLSRLNSALTDFFSYVENPATFKPAATQRNSSRNKSNDNGKGSAKQKNDYAKVESEIPEDEAVHHAKQLIIPVPLRQGLTVKIHNIPPDLSQREAEKLAAIVRAYAMPEEE